VYTCAQGMFAHVFVGTEFSGLGNSHYSLCLISCSLLIQSLSLFLKKGKNLIAQRQGTLKVLMFFSYFIVDYGVVVFFALIMT